MTVPEITAYVMALPVEDVRRLSATEIMGWHHGWALDEDTELWVGSDDYRVYNFYEWRPDEDRNQSRLLTDKVGCDNPNMICSIRGWNLYDSVPRLPWTLITPLDEIRAALIAHMIHMQEAGS